MTDGLERWRDPVFNNPYEHVPPRLVARLTEMAEDIMADENVAQALADGRIPRATGNVPMFPQPISGLPASLVVYNERLRALVAVAAIAESTDLANYDPPADTKSHVGFVLGQAFHQSCSLADVAIAAQLPAEHLIAIAKRTIPGTSWLEPLQTQSPSPPASTHTTHQPTFFDGDPPTSFGGS